VITLEHVVQEGEGPVARDLLALRTGLSRSAVKDAMRKGAVWLRQGRRGAKRHRLRRATAEVRPGDLLEIYYDPKILSQEPPVARMLRDLESYSGWLKPAGLLSQGSDFGDHCSLLRQVEAALAPRPAFLVHRLDREASGVVLVAHSSRAAAALSEMFRQGRVEKLYRVQVRGRVEAPGRVEEPLDGKPALTEYRPLAWEEDANVSTLEVVARTGRLHQIRRHLAAAGHPVMGDPRYGRGNKNRAGMRLAATALRFRCPLRKKPLEVVAGPADPGF
jgi:tRNA pseudouridine32 synthase/23S rRNA pseudouridine746 synthase